MVISTDDFDIFFELYSTGEVEEGKRQEENVETYIELRIYNLSDATYSSINTRQVVISDKDDEEIIVEHGSDITVDSGYMGNDTTLFVGEVVDKIRMRDGGDIYTIVTCVTSMDKLRRTKVNETLYFVTTDEIVRHLIGLAGVAEGYIEP
ncbi:MAG: hypothetical protein KAJ03_10640, partial [Gammaproteobacteria bacterium]|nr:hypothetical protein [Gammaproteobacteria bacterium]